tara:strand:+ start:775 stop:918 length:144 start_codon:yes stop_codon:yes gene_type:complete
LIVITVIETKKIENIIKTVFFTIDNEKKLWLAGKASMSLFNNLTPVI